MSNALTEAELNNALKTQTEEIVGVMHVFMDQVDTRFNNLESREDNADTKLDKLIGTIDAFVKRLDDTEVETAARDAQFDRLLQWAREVSVKTGIPLKNL